jgi:2-octaprenyl-6-methoxyphenol hydroxylase
VQPDHDCVVVGAGLVGAAQAFALSRLGLNVAVIDTRGPLQEAAGGDVRGLALAPSSRHVLQRLDLWDALAMRVMPIRHIHVSDQGRFGFTRMSARDVHLDALGYVCPADHLLHALETALTGRCEVHWRTEIGAIDTATDHVRIGLQGVGGTREVRARLVIGADGSRSRVREAIDVTTHTRDYRQRAIVANLTVEHPSHETAFERFTRAGPLALLPIARGRHVAVRCCADSAADALLALSDEQFLAELEAGFGNRFGRFSALGTRTSHPLLLSWADCIAARRVVLVGAAANSIHPNAAQGLNLGLRDVAGLAGCLARARGADRDIGDTAVLAEFARGREADHRAVIRLTDALAQLFSNRLPLLGALRDCAMLAIDITPPAKRWLIRRAGGLFAETGLAQWTEP